ncbi:unnamed protein product [Diatraea saccharalis]|uniref:acid phosphatase n=1 Tax=Diatraea saccharalis TaxID=40085 RepID=A0A9N9N2V8_9NEOP|nr:unnamed protein product [Diatraea saccharalis]
MLGRKRPLEHIAYIELFIFRSWRVLTTNEIIEVLEELDPDEHVQGIEVYMDPPGDGLVSDGDSGEEDCDDINRHGDRTPVDTYPTDPWRNESLWPVKFGELTNIGKRQHYALGRWLRKRYSVSY